MTEPTIRPASAEDVEWIKAIAVEAEMFTLDEVGFLDEMITGSSSGDVADHQWLVSRDRAGNVVGAADFAPEPYSDRMWNLYFLAVDPSRQGAGIGRGLVAHVEDALRQRGEQHARVLIVETSSTGEYAATRAFYARNGYAEESRIREFYGPGDHKVTFWKSLVA